MVEDVIDSLENMKLTLEEEEITVLLDEGCKEEIESYVLSLIGKFLTCKPFNKRQRKTIYKELGEWMKGSTLLK